VTVQRIYETALRPTQLGNVLMKHFSSRGFRTIATSSGEDRVLILATRSSPWHEVMTLARSLEVSITSREAALAVEVREESWQERIQLASTSVAAFPPALIGSAFTFWERRALDAELWSVIDRELVTVGCARLSEKLTGASW
jgi:hypothetical protein